MEYLNIISSIPSNEDTNVSELDTIRIKFSEAIEFDSNPPVVLSSDVVQTISSQSIEDDELIIVLNDLIQELGQDVDVVIGTNVVSGDGTGSVLATDVTIRFTMEEAPGLTTYKPGDWIIFDGDNWKRVRNSNPIRIASIQAALGGSEILFKGTWNAKDNVPYLSLERNFIGDFYVVSVGGAFDFTEVPEFDRPTFWVEGDWAVHNGQIWSKVENKDPIDVSQLPVDASDMPIERLIFKGKWDPSTNTPTLTNSTGSLGRFYIVEKSADFTIPDVIRAPTPRLPELELPSDGASGQLYPLGKITLGGLVPGLNDAVDNLFDSIDKFAVPFVNAKKSILSSADLKAQTLQRALSKTNDAVGEARQLLSSAENLLNEASQLTNNLRRALKVSGIYAYAYVGPVGQMSARIGEEVSAGLPVSNPLLGSIVSTDEEGNEENLPVGPNERVAAFIAIAGSDGGVINTINRTKALFSVLGGNAESAGRAIQNILPPAPQ